MAKMLFAYTFPFGLLLSIMTGCELFTGNVMKMGAAIFEGKVGAWPPAALGAANGAALAASSRARWGQLLWVLLWA
jgi:formate/nitrite transporter FocA (FNT family)